MTKRACDWHREDIKAAIRKSGLTMSELSRRHGFEASAVRQTLGRPWPGVEAVIAGHLGMSPQVIWPSRYGEHGHPLAWKRFSYRDRSALQGLAQPQIRRTA